MKTSESNLLEWLHTYLWVRPSQAVMWLHFTFFHCTRVRGARRVPNNGPVLVLPNHVSYYDSPLTGFRVARPIYYMAHKKYFFPPLSWLIYSLRGFPIVAGSRDAYKHMIALLQSGKCLVIYPEGTRSKDGNLGELQDGAIRMALTTGATIVPMSILGAFEAWPRSSKFPIFGRRIVLEYHKPIPVPPSLGKADLRERLPLIKEQVRQTLDSRMRAWRRLQASKRKRDKFS